ncbi:MAG: tRNA lysidine(34) synthetase TilS [Azospira sp.]
MAASRKKTPADPAGSTGAEGRTAAAPADVSFPPVVPAARPAPDDLPGRLAAFLRQHLSSSAHLCVGLSGGRDSVALLRLCHAVCGSSAHGLADVRLSALHVHHGLAAQADAWAGFCQSLCDELGVPLAVVRVGVDKAHPAGLEGAAREARYGAFLDCGADAVALAHHQDDQAETLLFRLLRGSGVNGAAAMVAARTMPRMVETERPPLLLLRPLLQEPRERLQRWLEGQGGGWVDDPSNTDTGHARNFLRHDILPRLESRFPKAGAVLARAAGHFAEAAALLDERAAEDAALARAPSGRLALAGLAVLSPPRRRNLLRYWLRRAGAPMPEEAVLAEMERQFLAGQGDAPRIGVGSYQVAAWRGELFVERLPRDVAPLPCRWNGEDIMTFGDGKVLLARSEDGEGARIRADLLADGAELRVRRSRDVLRPAPGRHRRDAQRLFQEAGIPPWRRAWLPALEAGGRLLWLAGVGVDGDSRAAPGEAGVLPCWVPPPGSEDEGRE